MVEKRGRVKQGRQRRAGSGNADKISAGANRAIVVCAAVRSTTSGYTHLRTAQSQAATFEGPILLGRIRYAPR